MTNNFPFSSLPQLWNLVRTSPYPIKLVWIGLDNAGKSSLIKRLKTGEFYEGSMPRTMGLSVDKLFYESDSNFEIISWDLGGQIYFRENLWADYLKGASAILYVLDRSDTNEKRLLEAKNELWKYVLSAKNKVRNVPLLILANKTDRKAKIDLKELKELLELDKAKNINLEVFQVSALSGLNLDKAFSWLVNQLLSHRKGKKKD